MHPFWTFVLTVVTLRVIVYLFWYLDQNHGQMRLLMGSSLKGIGTAALGLLATREPPKRRQSVHKPASRSRSNSQIWDKGPGFAMS